MRIQLILNPFQGNLGQLVFFDSRTSSVEDICCPYGKSLSDWHSPAGRDVLMEPDEMILSDFTFTGEDGEAHVIITNHRLRVDVPKLADAAEELEQKKEHKDLGDKFGERFAAGIVRRADRWLLEGIRLEQIHSFSYKHGQLHLRAKFVRFLPPFEAKIDLPSDIGRALVLALEEAIGKR